ncbi:MAG: SCO family protein [Thermoflavifilum sp.]|nr:SCO family protein [Thermoflavifilum sp.]
MQNKRMKWLMLGWPFLILALSVMIYAVVNEKQPLPDYGQVEGWNSPASDTQFVSHYLFINTHGQLVSLKSYPSKILVVNFFFSRCPDVCPRMMADLNDVVQQFAHDDRVHFLSFTVDPTYDTPDRLAHYASAMNLHIQHWDLLTGNKQQIYRTAVVGFRVDASSGNGQVPEFIHTDKIMLVDAQGNIRGYYSGIVKREMQLLVDDIKKLEHE